MANQKPHISLIDLMTEARQELSGNWGIAIGFTVIYYLVSMGFGIVPFGFLIFSGPLLLGIVTFYLNLTRKGSHDIGDLFKGFDNFGNALLAYIIYFFAILFGLLLLIVPGAILAIGWSQTFYIMHDDPNINSVDALKKSWAMMDGYKADYFILALIFSLFSFLTVFTLFIGMLWLIPLMQTTYAKFYDKIKYANFPEDDKGEEDDYASHLVDF